jgi:hypothetical protein
MGMKLLPRKEFDAARAREQKAAIDEGAKLARRVDNLREVAATEEENLRNFRTRTIKKIREDIEKEEQILSSLRREVKNTRSAIAKEEQEIETKRKYLQDRAEALDIVAESIDKREKESNQREKDTEWNLSEAHRIRAQAETKNLLADQRLLDAKRDGILAQEVLESANRVHEKAQTKLRTVNLALAEREKAVKKREYSATVRERRNATKTEELRIEWTRLKDRKAMFERTIKRQSK